jgi:hypothetical protein
VLEVSERAGYMYVPMKTTEGFLLITKSSRYGHDVLESIPSTPSRLYYIYIKLIPYGAYKMIF